MYLIKNKQTLKSVADSGGVRTRFFQCFRCAAQEAQRLNRLRQEKYAAAGGAENIFCVRRVSARNGAGGK